MTSNLGSDLIRKTTEVGFGVNMEKISFSAMKEKIDKAVEKHFKPEFINRIDGIVIFKSFDKEDLVQIIDMEIGKLSARLAKKDLYLEVSDEAKHFLADKGYKPEMGARPLRRAIEYYLEDPISEMILKDSKITGVCVVSLVDNAISIASKKEKKQKNAPSISKG